MTGSSVTESVQSGSLNVPDEVTVQYENMALSLAYLNKKIDFQQKDDIE